MTRAASSVEEELRRALELLAAAEPEMLDEALESVPTSLASAASAVRNAVAYRVSVDELESALVGLPSAVAPATARAAQATENVWRQVASEFGLLSSTEVSALLGASKANRVYASQLRKRGQLLAVQRKNAFVFPGFQFDLKAGATCAWVAPLLQLAERQGRSAADVIMWMMSPTTYLDGDRPADRVDDHKGLLDLAERAWGIEW